MKVKVLSSRSEIGLEHAVNEFLAERRHEIIDIKFSTCAIKSMGVAETTYTAMIVYDTEG